MGLKPHNPKNILFVIGQLVRGGAERQLLYLVQGLDRAKYRPLVCVLSSGGSLISDFESAGVPVVVLERHLPRFDVSRLFTLLALIKNSKPDLIHSFILVANFYSCLAGMVTHVPILVSKRNTDSYLNKNMTTLERWLEQLMVKRSAGLIANSQIGATWAVKRAGMRPEDVYVVHNGIDVACFDTPRDPKEIRLELGLIHDVPVIGIVGSIVGERKDHTTFFRAMKLLSSQCDKRFQILCVGSGPKLEQTRGLTEDLGLGQRTVFTGERTDIPDLMSVMDLLVSSSQWEGMPNVIMEAMAARKPVVATAVGGTPELVAHEATGLMVPPQDPITLAKAAQILLEDPDLASQMGLAGRQRIEQYFSIKKMVYSTEAIYQRLLSKYN